MKTEVREMFPLHKAFGWPLWITWTIISANFLLILLADIPGYNSPLDKIGSAGVVFVMIALNGHSYVWPVFKRWFNERYAFALVRRAEPSPYEYLSLNHFSITVDDHYRRLLRSYPLGQYIYILKDASVTGYYKIGKTNLPARRVGRFDVVLPFDIHIMAIISCDNATQMETYLHHKYARFRASGEWFNLDAGTLRVILPIESIKAGGM